MALAHSSGIALVLGGARSGKSAFSEKMAMECGLERHYVATGRPWDAEMEARIALHRAARGGGWATHEEPLELASRLEEIATHNRVVLVDCLTLWVTNLLMAECDMERAFGDLVALLPKLTARVIFVSNEVGLGIVPDNAMARAFRDHAGRLHQMIASEARDVFFVAAGLPLRMKG